MSRDGFSNSILNYEYQSKWAFAAYGSVQVQPNATPVVAAGVPLGHVIPMLMASPCAKATALAPLQLVPATEIVQAKVVFAAFFLSVKTRDAAAPGAVVISAQISPVVQATGITT